MAETLPYLLAKIAATPGCRVIKPKGKPVIDSRHVLPEDLRTFYELCGGLQFFRDSVYGAKIVAPAKFKLANPVIMIGLTPELLKAGEDDISGSWYVMAEADNSQYITIDLHPERLGRCYNSFWDRHAIQGSSAIIARSFTELLTHLYMSKGDHYWYWLRSDFESLGDAYD